MNSSIHPAHRRQGLGSGLAAALTSRAAGHGVRVWAHGDLPAAAALARSAGFTRVRSLWQMRMSLKDAAIPGPAYPAGVTVRTFRPAKDEQAWLAVNRRAFAHHPEQGSWTLDDLRLREEETWFDPAGFFLAERDGQLAGFHWTKVHADGGENGAPIGEVYVVGVDPGQQGGGLGRALTLAGLAHLRDRGLAERHALRGRGQHGGRPDVYGTRLQPLVSRRHVQACGNLARASARPSPGLRSDDEERGTSCEPKGAPPFGLSGERRGRKRRVQRPGGEQDKQSAIDARTGVPSARRERGKSAPKPQCLVQLALRERTVACRDGRQDLGVEFYLTKRHVVANTKVNLHGNRAHLQ